MKNRIHNAINRYSKALEGEDPNKLASLSKKLDMTVEEHSRSVMLKNIAQAEGKITVSEATTVSSILGNNIQHFNSQSLAAKVAVSALLRELLNKPKQKC